MKNITLIIIILISITFSQNIKEFPLWGTNWVIAEGINKRVYPSIIPLQPKKIVSVEFREDMDSVIIEYANFMHRQYAGSWDVLKDFNKQVAKNRVAVPFDSINTRYGKLHIQYQPYNDSVWSLHKAIIEKSKEISIKEIYIRCGTMDSTFLDISEVEKQYSSNNPGVWSKNKPIAYITRNADTEDINEFKATGQLKSSDGYEYYFRGSSSELYGDDSEIKDVKLGNVNIDNSVPYQDYLKVDPISGEKKVYEYIWDYEVKTDNLGYWQIHVHPEKWFFPRDVDNGLPLLREDLKKTYKETEELRQEYINNRSKFELKYWANPYYCDSISVISSFAFINTPNCKDREWIWLSGMAEGTKVEYEHTPDRMFRWSKSGWDLHRSNVLRKLYTKEGMQEELARSLYDRCPGWMSKDELNSKELFKKKWIYPDNDQSNQQSRWIWSGSGLPIGGNKSGSIKAIGHTWERNWEQLDNIFIYNNCPCSKMSDFGGLTKAQLTKYIYYPIRTCSIVKMKKELRILFRLKEILDADSDQKKLSEKILMLQELIIQKEKIIGKTVSINTLKKAMIQKKITDNLSFLAQDIFTNNMTIYDIKKEIEKQLKSNYLGHSKCRSAECANYYRRIIEELKGIAKNLEIIENEYIFNVLNSGCMQTWVDKNEFKYF